MIPRFSSETLVELFAAVRASPGREICGLLVGAGEIAARPAANVAADPVRFFEIDPAALIAAHRAARGGGAAVVGHYHSHPIGDPTPSPRDAADAAPDGALWLILTLDRAKLWRAVPHGGLHGRFDAVAFDCATVKRGASGVRSVSPGRGSQAWSLTFDD